MNIMYLTKNLYKKQNHTLTIIKYLYSKKYYKILTGNNNMLKIDEKFCYKQIKKLMKFRIIII